MMICPQSQQIDAYHDGELSPADARLVEEHVAQCEACRQQLADARAISTLLSNTGIPQLSAEAVARLHQASEQVQEYSVLRMTELLTAAAAAVLFIALMGWWRESPSPLQPAAPWERTMVTLQVETPVTPSGDSVQMAKFLTTGLGPEGER